VKSEIQFFNERRLLKSGKLLAGKSISGVLFVRMYLLRFSLSLY
jgi:hypothetical protein